jgi:hypothetical protein
LGAGCNGVQALSNRITGGDQGLVVKDNDGAVISRNNIFGGNNNALYFKGATNAAATYNTIANIHGVCVRVGADGATKSQNITLQHNRIFGRGSAALLAWADAAGDLGGGVCDSNIYAPRGTGKFGAVRADASVVSLAELRAAWAGYDNPNNDAASRLLPDELPLQANTIRRHHK